MRLSDFIELVGALVMFFSIAQVASDRLYFSVKTFALQSLCLSLSIMSIAIYSGYGDLYISAILTFLIKVVIIPIILIKLIDRARIKRDVEPFVNITFSLLITGGIVLFSFFVTQKIHISGEIIARRIFPISLAVILIGGFIMVSRKKAITQIIGYLTIENGIMLAGTSITKGMPLVVELGIFFDVAVGALISGILIYQIRSTIDSIDTTKLSDLRE